jgi:hypothetical protein
MQQILEELNPLYLNSKDYQGKDWRPKHECRYYVNRKLCLKEIVADYDGIDIDIKQKIINWYKDSGFKFAAYSSSDSGLHIHFFTQLVNKYHKKQFLAYIQKKSGFKVDDGPIMRGWIRAEDSIHPRKGCKKELIYSNLRPFFYTNELDDSIIQKVISQPTQELDISKIKPEKNKPRSIKLMENNVFANGRKRIMFCLISWYVSQKKTNDEVYALITEWMSKQPNCYIPNSMIYGSIHSSKGAVRDSYRIKLLKELGFAIKQDAIKPEIKVFNVTL